MTRILVTGATGFVGTPLCLHLAKQGFNVRAATRNDQSEINPAIEKIMVGELSADTDWSKALHNIDIVIHLAGRAHILKDDHPDPLAMYRELNLFATETLMKQAIQHHVKRFIFMSTIHVNGIITDKTPFSSFDVPKPTSPYGISKWEAEETLHRLVEPTAMDLIIIRSPLIYGPGVKGNMLRLMEAIWYQYPLPVRGIMNTRSLIGLDNMIDLITHCIKNKTLYRETIMATDGNDISTPELVSKMAYHMQKKPRMYAVPHKLLYIILKLFGKENTYHGLFSSQQISHYRTRWILDWIPPCTMDSEIARMTRWYKKKSTS